MLIMFPFLGGLASGALGLLGSSMNANAQASTNAAMMQFAQAQSAMNQADWQTANTQSQQQTQFSNALDANQIQFQQWLAQNGVQSRVADAKAAGISPLAALGMQPVGGGTVAVGGGSPPSIPSSSGPSLTAPTPGAGVAAIGQDISRALQATQSPEDRAVAVEKTRQDLEKGDLENELLRTQIFGSAVDRHGADQLGPGIKRPDELQVMPTSTGSGNVATYPSRDVEGAAWIDPLAKGQWFMKHQLLPAIGFNDIPDERLNAASRTGPAAASEGWYKNFLTGDYYKAPSATWYGQRVGKIFSNPMLYRKLPGMF